MKKSLEEKTKERKIEKEKRLLVARKLNGVNVTEEDLSNNELEDFYFNPGNLRNIRQMYLDMDLGNLCYIKAIEVVDDDTFMIKGRKQIFDCYRKVEGISLKRKFVGFVRGKFYLDKDELEIYYSKEVVEEANGGKFDSALYND